MRIEISRDEFDAIPLMPFLRVAWIYGLSILSIRRSSAPEHVLSRGYAFNGRSVAVLGSSSRSTRITRKLFQISPGPRSSVNKADLRAGKDAGMIAAMRIPMSDFRNLLNGWILACVLAVAPAA